VPAALSAENSEQLLAPSLAAAPTLRRRLIRKVAAIRLVGETLDRAGAATAVVVSDQFEPTPWLEVTR
jgi:hypothetical protein